MPAITITTKPTRMTMMMWLCYQPQMLAIKSKVSQQYTGIADCLTDTNKTQQAKPKTILWYMGGCE